MKLNKTQYFNSIDFNILENGEVHEGVESG